MRRRLVYVTLLGPYLCLVNFSVLCVHIWNQEWFCYNFLVLATRAVLDHSMDVVICVHLWQECIQRSVFRSQREFAGRIGATVASKASCTGQRDVECRLGSDGRHDGSQLESADCRGLRQRQRTASAETRQEQHRAGEGDSQRICAVVFLPFFLITMRLQPPPRSCSGHRKIPCIFILHRRR